MTEIRVPSNLAWLRISGVLNAIHIEQTAARPQAGRCSFFAPDFALSSAEPWLIGQRISLQLEPRPLPGLVRRIEPQSEAFAPLHADILARIQAREFEKVVPMVFEEWEFARPLTAAMFAAAIRTEFHNQYNYGMEWAGEGLCGVTPELLFSLRGNRLTTMALAGTGVVGGPSLMDDPKERHEHQIVIEHVVAELKGWGSAEVGSTGEREFGRLKHLYTPIELQLFERPSFLQLVERLHPTAALGGWPRKPALAWLEHQAFHKTRGRFGAPFGFVDGDEMHCIVAIRCVQWKKTRAQLAAGCGVVVNSQFSREWNELRQKRQATRQLLGLCAP